jgi:hypothetical protein
MTQKNTITPIAHDLDNNYDENFPFVQLGVSVFDPPTPCDNIENGFLQSVNDKTFVKQIITKEDDDKLKSIKFKDENETCNHCFHKDAGLIKEKNECPVCRYKFESIELKNEILLNENAEPLQKFYNEYPNDFLMLPNYLANEPQVRFGNQSYFDFFRKISLNDEENP